MIDGTYKILIDFPMGRSKEGTVTLREESGIVYADLDVPFVGKKHAEGRVEGNTFTGQGSEKLKLLGKVDYTVKGEVSGDYLRIEIQSNKGDYTFEGVRV